MWNFYLDETEAREQSGDKPLIAVTAREGHELDNARREEMGFEAISFEDFKRILLDDRDPCEA